MTRGDAAVLAQNGSQDLGQGKVGKLLLQLAIPAITAQLVNMLYNIVDRIYIGHIPGVGVAALTGVGVTMPVIILIMAFSSLVGMGGAPHASIQMGKGNDKGAEEILGNCFVLLVGVSVVLTACFLIFARPLLMMFGASEQTVPYALEYMNIYVSGTLFVQLSLGLNAFITSQGFAKTGMLTVVIGAVTNILLDPLFIFVFDMGVSGAAWATILSQAVSCAWVMAFLLGKKTRLRLRCENLRLRAKVLLPVLALGVSPFIMQSTESLLSIVLNTSLLKYGGDLAVGAMTILASAMQILNLPMMGLAQGAQPIIGYNFGAGATDRVKKAFRLLFTCSVLYAAVFWAVIQLCPQVLVRLFGSDPQLIEFTVWAARIYFGAAVVLGVQISCQQTFISVGQAKSSLFLALLRKIILLIPLIYLLPCFFSDKVFAVFLAEPIADFLAVASTFALFMFQFNKILGKREKEIAEGRS